MHRPSRRALLTAAPLVLAVVAAVAVAFANRPGTATLQPLGAGPQGYGGALPADPTPDPTGPPADPTAGSTAERTATPGATTGAPRSSTPVRTTAPSGPASDGTGTAHPTAQPTAQRASGPFGPLEPGGVEVPYEPGRHAWDVTSNGIRIRVSVTAAVAGTPAAFHVTTSSSQSGCCVVWMAYGDSFTAGEMPCGHPDPDVLFAHVYNKPGKTPFLVQVGTGTHCAALGDGALYGWFDVAPGVTTAQGPALPIVKLDSSDPVPGHAGDASYLSLWGEGADADGYLDRFVAAWGDGTVTTFDGDGNACQTGLGGWPVSSVGWLPVTPPFHHYTAPGTYVVTLTAYSTACDGSAEQLGSSSMQWTVPH
jgi:hypothetical protein